jgi:plasmid stabilization system protein ParE
LPAYKVIILPEALDDLQQIHNHIAADSPESAARMVERLLQAIDSREEMPRRFAPVPTRRKPPYEPRAVVVRPYRVLYSIEVEGSAAHVRATRHGARCPWP